MSVAAHGSSNQSSYLSSLRFFSKYITLVSSRFTINKWGIVRTIIRLFTTPAFSTLPYTVSNSPLQSQTVYVLHSIGLMELLPNYRTYSQLTFYVYSWLTFSSFSYSWQVVSLFRFFHIFFLYCLSRPWSGLSHSLTVENRIQGRHGKLLVEAAE